MAIEFVEGGSLENWLKKLKKFSIGDALHAIITTAQALEHAHELKMIHRDIKPDNILLTKKGVIKVADLGLAKAQDDDMQLTKTGTGAGTPIYMAPEQARDAKHVDHRCDIYALGCMLYFFLTGQAPFKGETLVELIEAKEKGKFKPMRTFDTSIPERLDLIVDKMLAKKPELRYASCSEVVEELASLGMAHDSLSFFGEAAAPARAGKGPASKPPASVIKKPVKITAPAEEEAEPDSDTMVEESGWFVQFVSPNGKTLTKKMEQEELERMIKLGSIDAKAKVSRQADSGFRAIGTIREFQDLFRSKQVRAKTDPGAGKFKSLVDKYDKEEQSRRFWKNLRNKVMPIVFWLIVLGALGAGGWFGYKYAVDAGLLK
ncbi:MAG: serine/threonine-protein kinase [Gemmataceae bacterium]